CGGSFTPTSSHRAAYPVAASRTGDVCWCSDWRRMERTLALYTIAVARHCVPRRGDPCGRPGGWGGGSVPFRRSQTPAKSARTACSYQLSHRFQSNTAWSPCIYIPHVPAPDPLLHAAALVDGSPRTSVFASSVPSVQRCDRRRLLAPETGYEPGLLRPV